MSVLAALNAKTMELRKTRDPLAGSFQAVQALATASAKERGLKTGDYTVNEDDAIRAVNKAVKQVNDTLALAPNDEKSQRELALLESLLPARASEADIIAEIEAFKAGEAEVNIKIMGKVMAHLSDKFGAGLDKATASKLVKTALTA